MSFHEKSAWACLAVITAVYGPYFYIALRMPMAAPEFFWVGAIVVVTLLIAFHIVNVLASRSIRATGSLPPVDELDGRIELNAAKWSLIVLAFAVFTWIMFAMYLLPLGSTLRATTDGGIPLPRIMEAVQWLFAGFVLANIAYYGAIVLGYRRLALG